MAGTQSNLERLSMEERNKEIIRNKYNSTDEYSDQHPDALSPETPNASGEEKGKGTNTPMGYYKLTHDKKGYNATFDYSKINTLSGGDPTDIERRNWGIVTNLYGPGKEYGAESVDTSKNIAEGQYVIK